MARPLLPPHERKDDRLPNLRVTSAERAMVERSADDAGLSLVEFCRRSIFKSKVRPPMAKSDAAILAELNRIGVNLNQIARITNRGEKLPSNFSAVMTDLRRAIARIAGDGA